jgi:hypothetical protein
MWYLLLLLLIAAGFYCASRILRHRWEAPECTSGNDRRP